MPQPEVEALFPNVAKWVRGYGWIEIGTQEHEGFMARALDEGGLVYETDECNTLGEALSLLEKGILPSMER